MTMTSMTPLRLVYRADLCTQLETTASSTIKVTDIDLRIPGTARGISLAKNWPVGA